MPNRGLASRSPERPLGAVIALVVGARRIRCSDGSGPGSGEAGGDAAVLAITPRPSALAVDDAFVYWAEERAIRRAPKGGGAPETVVTATRSRPGRLALDRDFVYFADGSGGVHRAPKAGGAPILLAGFATELGRAPPALALDVSSLWVCALRGVFRLPLGAPTPRPRVIATASGAEAGAVAFHLDGHRLYGGDGGYSVSSGVSLYDPATGRVERDLAPGHSIQWKRAFAFDPTRQRAFVLTMNRTIERWDLGGGAIVWAAETDRSGWSMESAPWRAQPTGCSPPMIWNTASVALPGFPGPAQKVSAIAISRDGRRMVTGSEAGRITAWDVERRSAISMLETGEAVRAIAVLGDGERAVVSGERQACLSHRGRARRALGGLGRREFLPDLAARWAVTRREVRTGMRDEL